MLRVKKMPKLESLALSSHPSEVNFMPMSAVLSPLEDTGTKEIVSRKMNKVEQAKEGLIQWIQECNMLQD